jgi:hypothetical protein
MVIFHSYVAVYQRVIILDTIVFDALFFLWWNANHSSTRENICPFLWQHYFIWRWSSHFFVLIN